MSNAKVTPHIKEEDGGARLPAGSSRVAGAWSDSQLLTAPHANGSASDKKLPSSMPLLRLNRVMAFVDANIDLDLCLLTLATVAGMSPYYFSRLFKQSTGVTPHRYVLQRRMEQAKRLLEEKRLSVLHVAHQVGFDDQSQFTRVFHKIVGTTPSDYRKMLQSAKISGCH